MANLRTITLLGLALLAACSESPSGGGPVDIDTGETDGGVDIGSDADDAGADDTTDIDAADTGDTDNVDAADVDDAGDGSGDAEVDVIDDGSELGEQCETDEDCLEGFCLGLGPDGGVCTTRCLDGADCLEGFQCVLVPGSSDGESVCIPVDLCFDNDGDTYGFGPGCAGADCDDERETVSPAADEYCNDIDDDCDSRIDDNTLDSREPCETGAFGVCADGRTICSSGGVLECEQQVVPSDEACDGLDNDCDGASDEQVDGSRIGEACYDGTAGTLGVGLCVAGRRECFGGELGPCVGQVLPGAEVCDGLDNNCNGVADEGLTVVEWHPDVDGDGFGSATAPAVLSCLRPPGHVENRADCDDVRDDVYPGAPEQAGSGVDESCDGTELCFLDFDRDGYRPDDAVVTTSLDADCTDPGEALASTPAGDCDDGETALNPGATEVAGDGIDSNCDSVEICYVDADADGYRDEAGSTASSAPGDLSCVELGLADADVPGTDCDDVLDSVYPSAPELCDSLDNDCDTRVDEAAACLDIGEPCVDDVDCAAGFCEDGVCADPFGCNRPGSCVSRVSTTGGGGSVTTVDVRLDLNVGVPAPIGAGSSARYTLVLGAGAYTAGPQR